MSAAIVCVSVAKAIRDKTKKLIQAAYEVLAEAHPMTLRQCYYQLVSKQIIENNRGSYQALSKAIVEARKQEMIPWHWIEDRLRKPRHVLMFDDVPHFAESALGWYRRDVWPTQPRYVEVWLEKDALSGIFEDELDPFGVTLNVGRGFDGWSSIREAASRYIRKEQPTTILYYGDFDPSGENMTSSLEERLYSFDGCEPEIKRIAILKEDIVRYNLPPDFAKLTDSRAKSFIERYGNEAVELDALPANVLRDRLVNSVRDLMDLHALVQTKNQEADERKRIERALKRIR
jgi:hypothetical protein